MSTTAHADPGQSDEDYLTANNVSWSLEVNPERLIYLDRRTYLVDQASMAADDPPDDIDDLCAADNLYEIRCYPTTPVGFMLLHGSDRAAVIRTMREALEE